jgi:hypothetical protein
MKEKDDSSPVVVFAGTQWEAGLVKSMLEDNEIQAFLKDEILGFMTPWNVASGGVKVVVASHDEEKAKLIVADYYKNEKEQ